MAFWNPFLHAMVLVRTTVATRAQAEALARRLVDGRLAACVHVAEIASVYRWEGRVRQETEFLVEARTGLRRRAEVAKAMLAGHPYATPMLEAVPAGLAAGAYLDWAKGELR